MKAKKIERKQRIDKNLYHQQYLACKANQYKNKRNIDNAIEIIIYKEVQNKKMLIEIRY